MTITQEDMKKLFNTEAQAIVDTDELVAAYADARQKCRKSSYENCISLYLRSAALRRELVRRGELPA